MRLALRLKCDKLEWWVLTWNAPALKFYRTIGATGDGDERAWRLRGAALKKFAKEENWGLKDGKWFFDGQAEFSFFEKQPYKIAQEALQNDANRS